MRSFVDSYLFNLVHQSINSKAELPPKFFSDAKLLSETIPSLQTSTEDVCKLLVDPDHVKTIISVDAEADGKTRMDRIAYLQSLTPSPKYTSEHRTALECVLVSELLLAMGDLSVEHIVYHRARTFAYSLIFIPKTLAAATAPATPSAAHPLCVALFRLWPMRLRRARRSERVSGCMRARARAQ